MKRLFLGAVTVDLDAGLVSGPVEATRLTRRELVLLQRLVHADGQTVSRDTLLQEVWGLAPSTATRCVDSTVHRVRRKIEANPSKPKFLLRQYGEGYRLVCPVADAIEPRKHETAALVGRGDDIRRIQSALAGQHRAVALVGALGVGLERLARACAESESVGVFEAENELVEWLASNVAHRGLLIGRGTPRTNLLLMEIAPLSMGAARDLLVCFCQHPLTDQQMDVALSRADGLPGALIELADNINVFGPDFALSSPLLVQLHADEWQLLDSGAKKVLFALAHAPVSVSVAALATCCAVADIRALRTAGWAIRTGDRLNLSAPARAFVRTQGALELWPLVPWLGERGKELATRSSSSVQSGDSEDDFRLMVHAAETDASESATWALLGAAGFLREVDHVRAEALLTRHIAFERPADMRSALFAFRSSVHRVRHREEMSRHDARQALQLARSPRRQMLAHAAMAYVSVFQPEEALQHLLQAIELSKIINARVQRCLYLAATSMCHRSMGDLVSSRRCLEQALALAPSARQSVVVRLRLALVTVDIGDIPFAMHHMERGIREARLEGMQTHLAMGLANQAFLQFISGGDPLPSITECVALSDELGFTACNGVVHGTYALHEASMGRFEESERCLHKALDTLVESPVRAMILAWLTRLEMASGRPGRKLEECLALCEPDRERVASVRILMGQPNPEWPETGLLRATRLFDGLCRRLESANRSDS